MDILIKNMEMPSCCGACWECEYGEANDKFYCSVHGKEIKCIEPPRPADCPLVALPSHGRLIEAEKLQAVLAKWEERARCGGNYEFANAYKTVREIIDDRDCVLEANNGSDN